MNADLLKGFYLGDLLIEPAKGRVTSRQGSEHLPPKATEVLLCLARRPGEIVTHDELIECAWGEHQGSRDAVTHAVSEVRHALNDQKDDPEFIQTLPRRGYRLLVTPTPAAGDTATVVLGAKNSLSPDELGLFENLNRRGVLETGIAYLILGWLLIQVADIVFSQLLLPQWVGTFVTVLVIAGFPIALVLSWFLEFRDGKAVVDDLSPHDARRRRFGRTYLSVLGALAIASIGVFIYDQSIGLPEVDPEPVVASAAEDNLPPVLENSIAVLPFLNIDGSEDTQIFADGLVDDVITRLSRVPGLLVSSRGDSYTLEPNSASNLVRERLRVAMYLEGSVQSAGNELRVIVQLIDSDTGFHILSRSFDRTRDEFFEVRDEVTQLTVANVRVALPQGTQAIATVAHDDPVLDAYILYRRGLEAAREPSIESIDGALEWFDAALEVDPEYAAAHAGKCVTYAQGYAPTDNPEFIDLAESSCSRALELNANLDVIYTALGQLYRETGKYFDAEAAYLKALDTSPSNVDALIGLGGVYDLLQQTDKAEELLVRAIGLHPGDWSAYNFLGAFLFRYGRYLEAAQQFEVVVALDHTNVLGYANLGTAYMLAADFASAAPAFQNAIELEPRPAIYSNLGLMHYYLGNFEAATQAHLEATRLAPNNYLVWSNLGDAYWAAGRFDASNQAFEKALSLARPRFEVNPNDPGILMDVAWIRAMLDDIERAYSLIGRALEFAPDDPYAHFIKGLIQLRDRDHSAALKSVQEAADKGYTIEMLVAEPHLAPLRDNPEFRQLQDTSKSL
ncbi:MAG: tetratricopeptide repeat protein [Woeseiaceae bacterium]|nr:tetratricopeptide repeat protein [Woeseiaceae bacterium]NIP20765.1 tetratricopeptide repeat protein [Woeseiaceae bacterium]NIS89558.1 tetratricopeptide repeat protein [Woeseiaceae bacterium]